MQEMQVQSLGGEDALEEEMATRSSIVAGESHGQRRLAGCSPWVSKELDTAKGLNNKNNNSQGNQCKENCMDKLDKILQERGHQDY